MYFQIIQLKTKKDTSLLGSSKRVTNESVPRWRLAPDLLSSSGQAIIQSSSLGQISNQISRNPEVLGIGTSHKPLTDFFCFINTSLNKIYIPDKDITVDIPPDLIFPPYSHHEKPAWSVIKMANRNRRANVPDVDNTIDLVQVDGLVSLENSEFHSLPYSKLCVI